MAEADLVESATLVAVMVTVWPVPTVAGAVYKPVLESVPTAGVRLQVTPVLLDPVTVAENCWVWDAAKVTVVGVT